MLPVNEILDLVTKAKEIESSLREGGRWELVDKAHEIVSLSENLLRVVSMIEKEGKKNED